MHNNVTIHVGLPKAASTTIQFGFLSKLENIDYYGIRPDLDQETSARRQILACILNLEEAEYRRQEDEVRAFFESRINGKKPVVISDEDFSRGHVSSANLCRTDRYLCARRLQRLFPNAKIVIMVRNQLKLLPSLYSQWMKNYHVGRVSIDKWIDIQLGKHRSYSGSIMGMANYDLLYKMYCEIFGDDQVTVFLFEQFCQDTSRGLEALAEVIGIPCENPERFLAESDQLNSRISSGELAIRKSKLGGIIPAIPTPLRKMGKRVIASMTRNVGGEISGEQKIQVARVYAESNRAFQEATGLNLSQFNYPL